MIAVCLDIKLACCKLTFIKFIFEESIIFFGNCMVFFVAGVIYNVNIIAIFVFDNIFIAVLINRCFLDKAQFSFKESVAVHTIHISQ